MCKAQPHPYNRSSVMSGVCLSGDGVDGEEVVRCDDGTWRWGCAVRETAMAWSR